MRIVIDLQGAQCASRERGIGRYSLAISKAIVRNRGEHEVIIVLSNLFPDTIEHLRAEFDGILSQEKIQVWSANGPANAVDVANNWRRHTAELIRENFLASLQPDIVYITSLFDGSYDNAVNSIGVSSIKIPTAVNFYDLIPLIQSDVYLSPNPDYEIIYREKLDHLRRADIYLAISESSRLELIEHLEIAPDKVTNISAAADKNFKPIDIAKADEQILRKKFGLAKPFVMYSGATDERKNHLRLIKAFSLLDIQLREKYQLAIVGKLPDSDKDNFINCAKACGLSEGDVIITGIVSDEEMVHFYNLCDLFVFPSWHEGFGLPALEAMACRAPVIGSNTTSLPEVIGRSDALFDPFDEKSISNKIATVLANSDYRTELAEHGLKQSQNFSWDESGKRAIAAFEQFHALTKQSSTELDVKPVVRRKMAFVSPLPPERSGISDYSAELLPVLSKHYDVEVVVAQSAISDSWITENCLVRDVSWFVKNSSSFDRVVYHFGNSPFHQHMLDLLFEIPGIVVLHDFFLSGIIRHLDVSGINPDGWGKELYFSHGYKALGERIHSINHDVEMYKYPCNKTMLDHAQGVIVHSEHSRRLAQKWLGKLFADDWAVIPLLRAPAMNLSRADARLLLGLDKDAFIVSTFGMLAPTKQNQRLLDSWLASSMGNDKRCFLLFVGENHGGAYGANLVSTIEKSKVEKKRVQITGWIDTAKFHQYLAASDIGVQLRTDSRGETSAAVLDCLNYGLPTIVNANGSMADIPDDAVFMLPDEYDNYELTNALNILWKNGEKRDELSRCARELIATQHAPLNCANQYKLSIERIFNQAQSNGQNLIKMVSQVSGAPKNEKEWVDLAQAIAGNCRSNGINKLLIDVSAIIQKDLKSGIERVVRSILAELINNPPEGFRVEPVYAGVNEQGYRYARKFTLSFLDCPTHLLEDEFVEVFNGDVFLGLDLHQHIIPQQTEFYKYMRNIGGHVYFVVYDLLPVLLPEVFPDGASTMHESWLATIAKSDGVICISRSVADEMIEWCDVNDLTRTAPLKIGWFHLGADVSASLPTTGISADATNILQTLRSRFTFLMVGTVEPRKGLLQTIEAFDLLWNEGVDVNLVVVGSEGWKGLPEEMRRTVPAIVSKLQGHPELGKRLFWLNGISDEYLERIYEAASCLIAASEGEGFGLPLIEAAQHGLPIIARDIPVFHEVAGNNAIYFTGLSSTVMAGTIKSWLHLSGQENNPLSAGINWLTWKESTQNLLDVIFKQNWYRNWFPSKDIKQYWGTNKRLHTVVGKRLGRNVSTTGEAGFLLFGPYISLTAGDYQVLIRGEIGGSDLVGVRADICVNAGADVLAETVLDNPDENGNFAILNVSLEFPCTDFEIRVWVGAESNLTISSIKIQQLKSTEVKSQIEANSGGDDLTTPRIEQLFFAKLQPETLEEIDPPIINLPIRKKAKRKKHR